MCTEIKEKELHNSDQQNGLIEWDLDYKWAHQETFVPATDFKGSWKKKVS